MIDCPSCYGNGIKRRRHTSGEFVEIDCERCNGEGKIPDPNAGERQIAALERIADVLERIAASLAALERTR